MSSPKLLTKTIEAIKNRPSCLTYNHIADECNVSIRWLDNLVAGKIKDPGVTKIEAVYEFVTGRSLDV